MHNRTRLEAVAAVAVTTLLAAAGPLSATAQSAAPAPELAPLHRSANAVPGRYIVTLSDTADSAAMTGEVGVKALFTYSSALRGFAADLSAEQLRQVRLLPGVVAVEEDATVKAVAGAPSSLAPAASWGLDRIDQRRLPLDDGFTAGGSGQGVNAYILDTGIDYAHSEFGGRATFGYDAVGDGRRGQDCQGHGTHVAGTVGGRTYGVATEASLVSVRVLDCEGGGTASEVIAGMDWVAANAVQPAVLNASLGGGRSIAVNNAADALADSGVLPVVAAGNEAQNACNVSPASAERVLTVGATNSSDQETDFSNHGACLGLYAPGASIVSARLGGGSVSLNGTSMASPHVTGVAALYKSEHPTANATEVAGWIIDKSTKGLVTGISPGSPNRLLYTGGL
ncbi:S8 family peptidase [Streptomyces peucetius]|uniref:S8 family peptidase n=1 Tax=Streptomyces peucetius TaxID=1950 RepID=A0ABY6IC77_STRPE|nr:S8 family peptidase [Streptomyces peucetius]UYQ64603.1 S8 family peptidase [Streptomyces peucetius]